VSLRTDIQDIIAESDAEMGVAVTHLESGEETLIDADQVYPLCSVLKIPVLVEAFRQHRDGKFGLDNRWELTTAEKNLPSGILVFLEDGLAPTVRDLLTLMIIISDNTATDMVMHRLGVESINRTLRALGLARTHVPLTIREIFESILPNADPTQDLYALAAREEDVTPEDPVAYRRSPENDVGTPREMNKLLGMIFHGSIVDRAACDAMLDILLQQQLNDRLPRFLPPGTRCAHKTGTLGGYRNDSGIIYVEQSPHATPNGQDAAHVAVTIFSKWDMDAVRKDPVALRRRMFEVDTAMGQIGRLVYDYYLNTLAS
jgi:beta-lactamase class A